MKRNENIGFACWLKQRPFTPSPCHPFTPSQQLWLLDVLLRLDGDGLAGAVGAHADAVDGLRRLHRAPVVGDDDELRADAQLAQLVAKAVDVGFV